MAEEQPGDRPRNAPYDQDAEPDDEEGIPEEVIWEEDATEERSDSVPARDP